jgi:aconitate hydratase
MLGAGLLAKNAVEKGLKVHPYIKTSLSPGKSFVISRKEIRNGKKKKRNYYLYFSKVF